jgi:exosome complex exonuclease DIS3/RRP44
MINNKSDTSELTEGIRRLNHLARIFRKRRIDSGALTLASTQVKFSFDQETHNPTDVSFYEYFETNYLVEEFMLLANVSVSEKILSHFPAVSILRKHSTPK